MLPTAPIVSARSFVERAWPYMLAWSDLGLSGKERMTVDALARATVLACGKTLCGAEGGI